MTQQFLDRFPTELASLRRLFGADTVEKALPRLAEIYDYTEARWRDYANQLPDGRVGYLLVAEAPPWSDSGAPQYLLDPHSRVTTYMRAVQNAFPDTSGKSGPEALAILARHGFLLLDTTPFAMNYAGKRASPKYRALIELTARSYLQAKIDAAPLTWSEDLRIAFAVKRNAGVVICGSDGQLRFGDRQHSISTTQIAVNGAGYPDARALRTVYGIDAVSA